MVVIVMMTLTTISMMAVMLGMIMRSPGEKNFENRDVFPTLAEPRSSTLNSSTGLSPYLLLKLYDTVFSELTEKP